MSRPLAPHHAHAVLFDLDGTLVDHAAAARAGVDQWCVELGLPAGQWNRWRKIERRWFTRFERRQISHLGQRVERAREFLGRPDLSEEEALRLYERYLAVYRANWRAYDDARPALESALVSGATVGVLTNGALSMQTAKLERTGLLLDGVVVLAATDLAAAKPQPEAYATALARLGAEAAGSVLIGDDWINDVVGARRAGMRGMYLVREGLRRDRRAPVDEPVIASLAELEWAR
ncbi:HAD family hydrolase [Corynebacterium halotolerans]|nr:HAD family hydrolase [Corynebacterium halotolerans]